MSELQERLARLSPAQRAELEKRLLQRAAAAGGRERIPRRNPDTACPLSFAQRRLWFLEQLEPGNAAYHITSVWSLSGPLDVAHLEQSFQALCERHESLRTVFRATQGEPFQVVLPDPRAELTLVHLPGDDRKTQDTAWNELLQAEISRPFDLTQGPLLRPVLVRFSDTEHRLLLVIHHIISDGWSMGVLWRELSEFYRAAAEPGHAGKPAPLEIQYPDFAAWQAERLKGETLQKLVRRCRELLEGAPTRLELPLDRPRPAVQTHRGARHNFVLPTELVESLKALARSENASLFMVLLAAFQVLLYRYTHQEDLLVGSPVANRGRTETEPLLGFFVNTLVLRGRLEGDPSFLEMLVRTRENTLGALALQELPFEALVEELQPERSMSHTPLFQVMFSLQNAPRSSLSLPGVQAERYRAERRTSMFDITLDLTEWESGLHAWLEYSTDCFDSATIERMAVHYETLLRAAAAAPETAISALPLLTEAERRQQLVEWNDNALPLPTGASLHGLFREQVQRTPSATALEWRGTTWTYAELDERSDHLARRLRARGVGPEVRVGVCLERTPWMIAAVLAVLKAGGAYVPLDPAYPRDRLDFMLQDAEVAAVVTETELACGFQDSRAPVVFVDADDDTPPSTGPFPAMADRCLAYVMYTSGSTGRPKGVSVEHRSVIALVEWSKEIVTADDLKGLLGSTSLCFDLSVFEIFATLLQGGTLILAKNLLELPDLPSAAKVTLVNTVPSILAELLRHHPLPRGVRTAILCGEPLPGELVDELYAQGVERVYDLYGPTEDTVYSTCTLREAQGRVTIGRPIANSQAYVLDRRMQPVPLGVAGELYLGGAGLARGYLHRPELTAERFVGDPFSRDPEARLYRTGDLVRYFPDGCIQFLGRMDTQVKIRGFRIELGEIEAVLRGHPGVAEAAVIVREDTPGDKRIAAYFIPTEPIPTAADLRAILRERLPEHMVPAAFVTLDTLPLLPNGKLNRKALPVPTTDDEPPVDASAAHGPTDALERQLVAVWKRTLGVPHVRVQDSFFDLGGHSLLALRLFQEIEQVLGRTLPLATLFQAPTVAQMADVLRRDGYRPDWHSLVPIQPEGSRSPFFCVHGGGGHVMFMKDLALRLGTDQPFYGIQPAHLGGTQERHRTIEEMAEYYVHEMRQAQPEGPYLLGGASYGGVIAYEMAQRLRRSGQEVGLLALFDTHTPGYGRSRSRLGRLARRSLAELYRLEHHVGSLVLLEAERRADYIREKVQKARYELDTFLMDMRRNTAVSTQMESSAEPDSGPSYRELLAAYAIQPYPGRVTLFRASRQFPVERPNPTLGWATLAQGGVEIVPVPGFHAAILSEPRVRFTAEKLRKYLGG